MILKENNELAMTFEEGKSTISLSQSNNFFYKNFIFTNADIIELIEEKLANFSDVPDEPAVRSSDNYSSAYMNDLNMMIETKQTNGHPELHVKNLRVDLKKGLAQFVANDITYTVNIKNSGDEPLFESAVTVDNKLSTVAFVLREDAKLFACV